MWTFWRCEGNLRWEWWTSPSILRTIFLVEPTWRPSSRKNHFPEDWNSASLQGRNVLTYLSPKELSPRSWVRCWQMKTVSPKVDVWKSPTLWQLWSQDQHVRIVFGLCQVRGHGFSWELPDQKLMAHLWIVAGGMWLADSCFGWLIAGRLPEEFWNIFVMNQTRQLYPPPPSLVQHAGPVNGEHHHHHQYQHTVIPNTTTRWMKLQILLITLHSRHQQIWSFYATTTTTTTIVR